MRNLRLTVKLFFKDVFLCISFLVFFVYINYYQVDTLLKINLYGLYDSTNQLFMSLRISLFLFVIFMFISYEYFYKLRKSNLEECVKATNTGMQALYGNQFLVMLALSAVITLAILAYNLIAYFYLGINRTEYLIHILKNIFINIFLISLLGILIGMYAALVFKRLTAYFLLTLFALLTSFFGRICYDLYMTQGVDIYPLYEFFNLYTPSLDWTANLHFGYSVLPYRIELLLIWISAFSALIFLRIAKKRKMAFKTCSGICAVICLVNFALYVQPSSKFIMSYNPSSSLSYDLFYYMATDQKDEPADFTITNYNLELAITNKLSAKARLTVDNGNLPQYTFTLYHGYTVSKVTDQDGNTLSFTQNSDYLAITNNGTDLNEIVLFYSGYSSRFYSNSEGTCLPGYFPFYPHSGYISIYNVGRQSFNPVLLSKPVGFIIQIKSTKNVYCNLTENEDGSFTGVTDGLTIMAGFLDTMTVQGIEVIYPYLYAYDADPKNMETEIQPSLDSKAEDQVINKIFIMPNLNQHGDECEVFFSDYVTIR